MTEDAAGDFEAGLAKILALRPRSVRLVSTAVASRSAFARAYVRGEDGYVMAFAIQPGRIELYKEAFESRLVEVEAEKTFLL